jgi:hypothetical protein
MPDITKCINKTCRVRRDCYRWTSPPSEYQSYAYFNEQGKADCDYFWEVDAKAKPFNQTGNNLKSDAE